VIGKLHPYFYTTVGNGTTVSNARRFAREIAEDLKQDDVDAVIISST
jgi:glycine reductase